MSCLFHDWMYSDRVVIRSQDHHEVKSMCYNKRVCRKCGKIQENEGRFYRDIVDEYYYKDKWFTIGYKTRNEVK